MRLPVNYLKVGTNQLPDGRAIDVNCKNNPGLAKIFRIGVKPCYCCGSKPSHILITDIDLDRHPDAKCSVTAQLIFKNGYSGTVDHIKPRSKGGKNDKGNYELMCSRCNFIKQDHIFSSMFDLRLYVLGNRLLRHLGMNWTWHELLAHLRHQYKWTAVL